jgi:copper resistance protein B
MSPRPRPRRLVVAGPLLALVGLFAVVGAPAVTAAGQAPQEAPQQDHGAHGQPVPGGQRAGAQPHGVNDHDAEDDAVALPAYIPPVTAADRAAAFPSVQHHMGHRERINTFVLADQLEWQGAEGRRGAVWDARGWIGRDVTRLWFRTDGDQGGGTLRQARAEVFYGRAVHRWWDILAGVRQDARRRPGPAPAQTWAAFGIQGLAPYWFDVKATAYVGAGGRMQAEADVEYDLLLTNRLILQPRVEAVFSSDDDAERGLAAGVSSTGAGVRLRYEVRREFAPYVGVSWDRSFWPAPAGASAAAGGPGRLRAVVGARAWF